MGISNLQISDTAVPSSRLNCLDFYSENNYPTIGDETIRAHFSSLQVVYGFTPLSGKQLLFNG